MQSSADDSSLNKVEGPAVSAKCTLVISFSGFFLCQYTCGPDQFNEASDTDCILKLPPCEHAEVIRYFILLQNNISFISHSIAVRFVSLLHYSRSVM